MAMVEVRGLDGVMRTFEKAAKVLQKEIAADLQDFGNAVTKEARRTHKFNRRASDGGSRISKHRSSGDGDRSIKSKVKGTTVQVFIDPTHVSTDSSKHGKFNYIWAQHDGTKVNGKTAIHADPFLDRAVEKLVPNLEKDLLKTIDKILG